MIFKNFSESAKLLTDKIKEEGVYNPIFTFINPDAESYCRLVSPYLAPSAGLKLPQPANLVILDNGTTRAPEFAEFTDRIRKTNPETFIVIAIPVIPESEKKSLESACDSLLYLHADPLFFSVDQFYHTIRSTTPGPRS